MQEHPNTRVARRMWDATSMGDRDLLLEIFAPDIVWRAANSGDLSGEFKGVDTVLDLLACAGEGVDEMQIELCDVFASDRGAVLHYRVHAERGHQVLDTEILLALRIVGGRVVEAFTTSTDPKRQRCLLDFALRPPHRALRANGSYRLLPLERHSKSSTDRK